MLRLLLFWAFCFLCVAADESFAKPGHGGVPSPTPLVAPVLQNVADTFGNLTPAGRGSVRLSSVDINYGTALNPSGLDIYTGTGNACATWSVSQTGGTAGHWTLIAANTAEGSTAITPTPSSAGVTAHLNGGPYTFAITCKDASGNQSNTATLTRAISTGTANNCGAFSVGTGDRTDIGYAPAGFASSLTGCEMLFSTGYVNTGRTGWALNYTNPITVTWADTSRPGAMVEFETKPTSTSYTIQDITTTGPSIVGVGAAAFVLAGTGTINATNIHAFYTKAIRDLNSNFSCFTTNSPAGGTVSNFGCDWTSAGFAPTTNYTYSTGYLRHGKGDILKALSAHDFHLTDIVLLSQRGPSGVHPDSFQISDGATPHDFTVTRLMYIAAGDDIGTQGPYFGGSPQGAGGTFKGYVSDAGCTGAAGKTFCLTSGIFQANSTGSIIYGSLGSPIGIGDGITMDCGSSNCNSKTTATLSLGSNITYGSAASPATFWGYGNFNSVFDQVFMAGWLFNGLTISTSGGTSSFSHYAHVYETTTGVTPQGAPNTRWVNCSTSQLFTGTFTLQKGMEYQGISGSPCSNVTTSNILSTASNTTTLGTYYTNGDPKACLEAKSTADWDAMTVKQAMVYAASCAIAKSAGPLDLGAGDFANPFGSSATPTWQDGTVVGTGFS